MSIASIMARPRGLPGVHRLAAATLVVLVLLVSGCAGFAPVMDAPKPASAALSWPTETPLAGAFSARTAAHPGTSGFHLLAAGIDSFALRMQIAARAERTLDLQYFQIQQDNTGKLLLGALLAAADRGVRVRVLVDDAQDFDDDALLRAMAANPNIEVRVFNPYLVRKALAFLRGAEYLFAAGRLNYRMHNKLFVGDNAIAVTGGRNIGDEYFQASTDLEFGDFDLAVVGPMVRNLSQSFDVYWNDRMAVPVVNMPLGKASAADLAACRDELLAHGKKMESSDYVRSLPEHAVLDGLVDGTVPLEWSTATLAYDTPEKVRVVNGEERGRLMWRRVAAAAEQAQRELVVVTPYLVPGASEMALLARLRERGVKVRMLTNSLASSDVPIVHAAYLHYRVPLLEMGADLYEVRARPGRPGDGKAAMKGDRADHYSLHAKVFVIDRERAFVGSMNFDRRSLAINTEIGLIIDSPKIARQLVARFETITKPSNSYRVLLDPVDAWGYRPIVWVTEEGGTMVRYTSEPDVDLGMLAEIHVLSLLPIDGMM